jgi:hypothetical protein
MHTYMFVFVCVYIYTYTHMYIYIYTYATGTISERATRPWEVGGGVKRGGSPAQVGKGTLLFT